MLDFNVFSLLEFPKRTARSHGIKKNGNCKRKSRVQKLSNCTLRDWSSCKTRCSWPTMYAVIYKFITFSVYVVWILRLIYFTIELTYNMITLYSTWSSSGHWFRN